MHTPLTNRDFFNILYANVNGYSISAQGRDKLGYFYFGHFYGEITYGGFSQMLKAALPQKGEVFYDLGSGTGKAVLLASLLGDFSKLRGIEVIKDLHNAAVDSLAFYKNNITLQLLPKKHQQDIDFIHDDFANSDWSDANILFMNATCFSYELSPALIKKLEALKKGTRVLTNTLPIPSFEYVVERLGNFSFTWGKEQAFLHTKL